MVYTDAMSPLLLSFIQELCNCYLQWDHAGVLPQSHRMVLRSCLESEFSKLGVVSSHSFSLPLV